jgi:single-strand DNA-binding protein
MNKVWITGRLIKDPELTKTTKGTPNCQFCIAVNRPVIRDGKKEADFINCIVWNKQAENLVKFQRKGNLIGVQGQFRTDKYEVNGQTRYKSYVLADEVEFMEPKKDIPNDEKQEFENASVKTVTQESIEINDEDLPF